MRTRANFHAVAPEILQVLANIYQEKVKTWQKFVQVGGDDEGGALDSVELSLLSLRILRRLIIAGWEFPNRHSEVQDFWNLVWVHFGEMLSFVLRISSPISVNVKNLVEKHLVQMAKLHLEMAKVRPAGFALLSDSIGLSRAYWDLIIRSSESLGFQAPTLGTKIGSEGDVHEENESILEKLTLKGLLLLRACAKMVFNPTQTFKYQQPEDKNERKRSVALIKGSLFTENFVREIMETLVTKFFRFREQDLRDWEEGPDEWERREDGEGDFWEFSIRSCSEKLFLDLVINYKAILVEPLLNVFYSVASMIYLNFMLYMANRHRRTNQRDSS